MATLAPLALCLLTTTGRAVAQDRGAIAGTVTDASAAPVNGAQVSISELRIGRISDSDGRFRIEDVPVGTHTVTAQVIGYGSQSREVTVTAGETARVSFTLERSVVEVGELVATALGITGEERSLGYATPHALFPSSPDSRIRLCSTSPTPVHSSAA